MHEADHSKTKFEFPLNHLQNSSALHEQGHCLYSISLYYSYSFRLAADDSNLKTISALSVAAFFALLAAIFIMYDMFVRRQNAKIVDAAARSNAILSSLFPSQVRDRLLASNEGNKQKGSKLQSLLQSDGLNYDCDDAENMLKSKHIADLFPETTILFADIVGFTAWSSVREPSQVFILLETIFQAFDIIAKKRRIFKVRRDLTNCPVEPQ